MQNREELPRGGGRKNAKTIGHGKNCVPPPPPSKGCLRKKKLSGHNCSIWTIFYPGPILGAKMEFLAPNFPLLMACTKLFEPFDHFKFVLPVEVICEGAFFASRGQCWYKD